ncbi:MAG: DUF4174 domain-containing protein [Pseudomonadota bacterium]
MIRALLVLLAICGGVLMDAERHDLAADGLSSVRWEYRPLLIFTPSGEEPLLSRQTTILADLGDELKERRLAVYIVESDRVYAAYGAPAPGARARELRQRFRVPDDQFRVVLVGLDGGAKLSRNAPINAVDLFSTIDAMPMRRRELRERSSDG